MDTTLWQLGSLAHYLGYGWCSGCRAKYVGDDFRRRDDTYYADTKGPCEGHKADQRLKINYEFFGYVVTDIKYKDPVIQSMVPQVQESGKVCVSFLTLSTAKCHRVTNVLD